MPYLLRIALTALSARILAARLRSATVAAEVAAVRSVAVALADNAETVVADAVGAVAGLEGVGLVVC